MFSVYLWPVDLHVVAIHLHCMNAAWEAWGREVFQPTTVLQTYQIQMKMERWQDQKGAGERP